MRSLSLQRVRVIRIRVVTPISFLVAVPFIIPQGDYCSILHDDGVVGEKEG